MRLLPGLANPGNPAMSPHAEGKKGTSHTDITYTVETREGRGEEPRNYPRRENGAATNTRDPPACGQQKMADYTGLTMLAQSMQ